jgi:uncharacterized protein YqhQ
MEGIMMKGPDKLAVAVRKPDKTIDVKVEPVKKHVWQKIPLVRGVCSMVESMTSGYKYLTHSAEVSMGDDFLEEDSKFDRWIKEKFGDKALTVVTGIAGVLGVVLAVLLFMVVPTAVVRLVELLVPLGGWKTLLESLIKASIFVGYLALVSRMKEIRRVFSYHGAEHKTIACYEAGEELTVENVRKHKRFHPRCGTSFLIIVLLISFVIGSVLPWGNALLRVALKLATLPVVMGVAYELIKLAGRYDNIATRIISAPGLWMQRLTTNEPDDSMIEVAIAAVLPVLPEDPEQGKW